MTDALFEVVRTSDDGSSVDVRANELSRGPWDPNALHGGPVAALVARSFEATPDGRTLHPARLTMEMRYPVPLGELTVRTMPIRPGKRVQVLGAVVTRTGDDQVLVAASLQQIRYQPLAIDHDLAAVTGPDEVPALPHGQVRSRPDWGHTDVAFHSHATEHRLVRGGWDELGPTTDWIRLVVPVVEGEEPSPLQRVVAAADFGNGISAALPFGRYVFINPDLTVHLYRLPDGEWVCLDAATYVSHDGVGQAECHLFDQQGRLGHSSQSLLLEEIRP